MWGFNLLSMHEIQVKIYDKSGRERNTFDLSDELQGYQLRFLSNTYLIGLKMENGKTKAFKILNLV